MKIQHKIILILSIILLVACSKDEEPVPIIDNSDPLITYWIKPVPVDTLLVFERSDSLISDGYGFGFKEGQIFIERKNSCGCGTPPITYENYDGTWERDDSTLNISVAYWGGTAYYEWKIISLSREKLSIHIAKVKYSGSFK